MQSQTVDVVKRLKEITQVMQTPQQVLEAHQVTSQDIQDLLDELQDHVESIDLANDLHSIGGLVPLLGYLEHSNAEIRAKSADVVSTMVENNPRSQQSVMECNGLESLLLNFTSDIDMHSRTQALGAISSLIRNNSSGIAGFRTANGYTGLRDALESDSVRFQRKALNLLHYLLQENDSDCDIAIELGFHGLLMRLVSSSDADVREAALRGLLDLTKDRKHCICGSTIKKEDNEKLRQILQERIEGISFMSPEDLSAAKEERELLDSLWIAFYNEPSFL
jgi:hsp70-interacting protein